MARVLKISDYGMHKASLAIKRALRPKPQREATVDDIHDYRIRKCIEKGFFVDAIKFSIKAIARLRLMYPCNKEEVEPYEQVLEEIINIQRPAVNGDILKIRSTISDQIKYYLRWDNKWLREVEIKTLNEYMNEYDTRLAKYLNV